MLMRIGSVEIWRILESVDRFLPPAAFFDDVSAEDLDVLRRYAPRQLCPETGVMLLPIQGFLLKTPDHVILVDACVGNDKTFEMFETWHRRSDGRFMAGLAAAGVTPADVNYVLCTHLHVDHVGWNTRLDDGRWVPTFPNASYLMPGLDHDYFVADGGPVYTESVLPVIVAEQAELVGPDHMLGDHVALIPTPGHTPGHVSVSVRDGAAEAIITGDALHSTVQCVRPHWNFAYDHDKPRAAASRRSLLSRAAETGPLVLGSHFPLPSVGRVRAAGDAFDWDES
jgi:glyoxylase-like metal-dependent hydrolase (beta-lactamase superfamily II)